MQKKLAAASALQATLAKKLIAASLRYRAARNVVLGLALASARRGDNFLRSAAEWLGCGVVAAILWPLHLLASALVFAKVRAALGIRKVKGKEMGI